MNSLQKILLVLLCVAILLGGLTMWVSEYSAEINMKPEAAYDRVYDRVMNYDK